MTKLIKLTEEQIELLKELAKRHNYRGSYTETDQVILLDALQKDCKPDLIDKLMDGKIVMNTSDQPRLVSINREAAIKLIKEY